ncbi:aminoacyl--tRNA ligase-related protein [Shinella zoogloeoides]
MRDHMVRFFSEEVRAFLRRENPAWDVRRVEAPVLTPRELISDAYTNADIWVQEQLADTDTPLVLRPETTPSTYVYMQHILSNHSKTRLPLCVWQAGRSYRREQEQPTKHMRLKEFWQLEFQCAYTADSGNDYHAAALEPVRRMIASLIHLPTRIVPSDRLPAYSQTTMDVEVDNGDKWMEVCSISRRTDFPDRYRAQPKKGPAVEQDILVLEIAIGLDRCLYNWDIASRR